MFSATLNTRAGGSDGRLSNSTACSEPQLTAFSVTGQQLYSDFPADVWDYPWPDPPSSWPLPKAHDLLWALERKSTGKLRGSPADSGPRSPRQTMQCRDYCWCCIDLPVWLTLHHPLTLAPERNPEILGAATWFQSWCLTLIRAASHSAANLPSASWRSQSDDDQENHIICKTETGAIYVWKYIPELDCVQFRKRSKRRSRV